MNEIKALTAESMKMAVFLDAALCSRIEDYDVSEVMTEAASTSVISGYDTFALAGNLYIYIYIKDVLLN